MADCKGDKARDTRQRAKGKSTVHKGLRAEARRQTVYGLWQMANGHSGHGKEKRRYGKEHKVHGWVKTKDREGCRNILRKTVYLHSVRNHRKKK